MNRPRKGSDWVAEARVDAGAGNCVVCHDPLPRGRRVLCARAACERTYNSISRAEARDKARARKDTTCSP